MQQQQSSVPFVGDFGEGRRAGRHQNLTDAVVELCNVLFGDLQEGVGGPLLGGVVYERPDAVLDGEFLILVANLGQNAHFEPVHSEEQVRIVTRVYGCKGVVPLDSGD